MISETAQNTGKAYKKGGHDLSLLAAVFLYLSIFLPPSPNGVPREGSVSCHAYAMLVKMRESTHNQCTRNKKNKMTAICLGRTPGNSTRMTYIYSEPVVTISSNTEVLP